MFKRLKKKLPGAKEREANKSEKEKLADRREEVLSRGKKFKYPLQFSKHRMIFVTIFLATIAVILSVIYTRHALYESQSTSDIAYRITTILPLPVAKIDGEPVRYSDYLMIYRSSITPVERQSTINSTTDVEGMKNYYKRSALTKAEDYAYVEKLAAEKNLTVSNEEIETAFSAHQSAGGSNRSRESFLKVLSDSFGMSESEYHRQLYLSLLTKKVETEIDLTAKSTAGTISQKLPEAENDFTKLMELLGENTPVSYESTGEKVSILNVDGGRAGKAHSLEVGEITGPFVSDNGDGYYFIKCTDKSETEVAYESLFIPFTELDSRLENLRLDNKIEEYISLPDTEQ
ncbi:MAG: SurA N-terminal domain-containing protein [Candidatus Saccharibacteria bacterium]|nr:SurA N-terminal domain-containing protein [Candidatus Saccharibacteria bacterium]